MTTDFTRFEFVVGKTYTVEIAPGTKAVTVTEHGEGHPEAQDRYVAIEYIGAVGSGPYRRFRDWDSEAELTIDSNHIVSVV